MSEPGQTTQILLELDGGDSSAADRLLPRVYDELRALAAAQMQWERPDHTLQPTALINEAYLRLVDQSSVSWRNRTHFFAIASNVVRRILVEHARKHGALKRGGGARRLVLSESRAAIEDRCLDLLDLDDALAALRKLNERQCQVVEMRFFGGLSVEETARALGVSPRTVDGEWHLARAWLRNYLDR